MKKILYAPLRRASCHPHLRGHVSNRFCSLRGNAGTDGTGPSFRYWMPGRPAMRAKAGGIEAVCLTYDAFGRVL